MSPAPLSTLIRTANGYVFESSSKNTLKAYGGDWQHFVGWCEAQSLSHLPPNVGIVCLYLTACSSVKNTTYGLGLSSATIKRRLAALGHYFRKAGFAFSRTDPQIKKLLSEIERRDAGPSSTKRPLNTGDVIKMCRALPRDLRGSRDRAILLLGFSGGLRRSEIVGLDRWPNESSDGVGWIELREDRAVVHLRGELGAWRDVKIGLGQNRETCPVYAIRDWLHLSEITSGPIFRAVGKDGRRVSTKRLNGNYVGRLVKKQAVLAKISEDVLAGELAKLYSAHSLRAGFASAADAEESAIQKQLGNKSPAMTRRYRASKVGT